MSDPKYEKIGDRLDHLAEECAEVIKAICKIKRFGAASRSNDAALMDELTDLKKRMDEVWNWYWNSTPQERAKKYPISGATDENQVGI